MNKIEPEIKSFYEAGEVMREEIVELRALAFNFASVGNNFVSHQLLETAARLQNAYTFMDDDHGKVISERLQDAQQSSRNMLDAVLAGSKMERDQKEDSQ